MAWEWVAPTATAATAVAGMWLAARSAKHRGDVDAGLLRTQLEAGARSSMRAERREAFAAFLSDVDEVRRLASESTMDTGRRLDALQAAIAINRRAKILALVGPESVAEAGQEVLRDLHEIIIAANDGQRRSPSSDADARLIAAMHYALSYNELADPLTGVADSLRTVEGPKQ